MKKRVISFVLTVLLFTNLISAITARGATNDQENILEISSQILTEDSSSVKSNFNFLNTSDLSDVKYTYDEDGKTYLVKESANIDVTEINTEIYEVGEESNTLVEKFTTYIDKSNDILTVSKFDNGIEISSQTIGTVDGRLEVNNVETYAVDYNKPYTGYVNYDGRYNKYYTTWEFATKYNGSNRIYKFTLSVVIGVLSGISGNPRIVNGVTTAAQYIVNNSIKDVFYTREDHELHQITAAGWYYGTPVGTRAYVDFYADSSRRFHIGSDFYEWHDPVEWPKGITIR